MWSPGVASSDCGGRDLNARQPRRSLKRSGGSHRLELAPEN
ncbi:hypothetical protein TIFTF001_023809 [Ficus carica]|uniref:Uncharacterized protein n=1 Tax=Ficus carica TaxID=3494 RepID=A0AA88AMB9_FICCA|nr:hypothetical protein TIFTF001_023809 [Ficus carica]